MAGLKLDLLLRGGPIFDRPACDALGVAGGRIAAVGRAQELEGLATAGTRVVELRGRPVLPGFVDAHTHLDYYAQSRRELRLNGIGPIAEVARLVGERAANLAPGEWILGRGWLRDRLERWPTAEDLDPVSPRHPVALASHDTHALWVNSLALRLARIDAASADPPGGEIVRREGRAGDGQPTGVLLEEAQAAVQRAMRRPEGGGRIDALAEVQEEALALGVVGVHDFEGHRAAKAFAALRAEGRLRLRVTMGITTEMLEREDWGGLFESDEWLRVGLVKVFADGALGSRTAFMLAPYGGDPAAGRGLPRIEADELLGLARRARARGLGVAVHAIGDAAVRRVLDAFERARADPSPAAASQILRVEHAQLVDPSDLPRFAALGVIASMQPNHCPSDRPVAEVEWGSRCGYAYGWRSLLASGARLAFGTDCPVEALDPLANLHAAVTRQDRAGEPPGGWYPEQCLDLPSAIRAYTIGSALAAGDGWRRGSLHEGKLADLVVLSEALVGRSADALLRARVELTVVDGRIVYERECGA